MVRDTVVVRRGAHRSISKGYVRGFDIKTGKRKWIFHTIPRKGEFGYDTWTTPGQAEASRQYRRPGRRCRPIPNWAWSMSASNCRTDRHDWASAAPGPHLFGESLVALDIETGKRKWHYQMIHHGLWDRDVSCAGDPLRHSA